MSRSELFQGIPIAPPLDWKRHTSESLIELVLALFEAHPETLKRFKSVLKIETDEEATQYITTLYTSLLEGTTAPSFMFLPGKNERVEDTQVHPDKKPKEYEWTTNPIQDRVPACDDPSILVLNHASDVLIGGSPFWHSRAQEEALMRFSNAMLGMPQPPSDKRFVAGCAFPYPNEGGFDSFGGGYYIKDVTAFRKEGTELRPVRQYDMVLAAAPDLNIQHKQSRSLYLRESGNRGDYIQIMAQRIRFILKVTQELEPSRLILGALGCGSFANNPYIVAAIFRAVLSEFDIAIPVEFNIYEPDHDKTHDAEIPLSTTAVFQHVFLKMTPEEVNALLHNATIPVYAMKKEIEANGRMIMTNDWQAMFDQTQGPTTGLHI